MASKSWLKTPFLVSTKISKKALGWLNLVEDQNFNQDEKKESNIMELQGIIFNQDFNQKPRNVSWLVDLSLLKREISTRTSTNQKPER